MLKSRVDFVVSDLPGCDSFTINIYGALAQREREMISARTKAGLAAAKGRGVKLGANNLNMDSVKDASLKGVETRKQKADDFAEKVKPVITAMQSQGKSLRAIAAELERLEVKTARGGVDGNSGKECPCSVGHREDTAGREISSTKMK